MAKTRSRPAAKAVTAERAARLVRILQLVGEGPQTRASLTRRFRLDVRSFYRDLDLIRSAGIPLVLRDHRYTLDAEMADAVARLPFPDPHLTLGEAVVLAKGKTAIHKKLQTIVGQITSSGKK